MNVAASPDKITTPQGSRRFLSHPPERVERTEGKNKSFQAIHGTGIVTNIRVG